LADLHISPAITPHALVEAHDVAHEENPAAAEMVLVFV